MFLVCISRSLAWVHPVLDQTECPRWVTSAADQGPVSRQRSTFRVLTNYLRFVWLLPSHAVCGKLPGRGKGGGPHAGAEDAGDQPQGLSQGAGPPEVPERPESASASGADRCVERAGHIALCQPGCSGPAVCVRDELSCTLCFANNDALVQPCVCARPRQRIVSRHGSLSLGHVRVAGPRLGWPQ